MMTLTDQATLRNLLQQILTTLELAGPVRRIPVPRMHLERWVELVLACLPADATQRLTRAGGPPDARHP